MAQHKVNHQNGASLDDGAGGVIPEGNPVENTGPPHFLHLVGTTITTHFMMITCVASYKEEARCIATEALLSRV